jgi:hypothetical protein
MAFDSDRAALEFLCTETDLAMTFLDIADTSVISETSRRNRKNARKAYDTVIHFLPRFMLTAADSRAFQDRLSTLRIRLESVGECF